MSSQKPIIFGLALVLMISGFLYFSEIDNENDDGIENDIQNNVDVNNTVRTTDGIEIHELDGQISDNLVEVDVEFEILTDDLEQLNIVFGAYNQNNRVVPSDFEQIENLERGSVYERHFSLNTGNKNDIERIQSFYLSVDGSD